jgi:hypothetical protein
MNLILTYSFDKLYVAFIDNATYSYENINYKVKSFTITYY